MENEKVKKVRKSIESERAEESSDSREHSENPHKSPKHIEPRKDFTCEIFKIEIGKLGKAHFGDVRKMLKTKLNFEPVKIKLSHKHGEGIAYVCFRSDKEKQDALRILSVTEWRGKKLTVKSAKAIIDPVLKRRMAEARGEKPKGKKKTVIEATASLAHLSYEEQLKKKESDCIKYLHEYAKNLKKASHQLTGMIQQSEKENKGLPCIWHGFKPSPKINGYRNKVEFAVGLNDQNERTVGFRIGKYSGGSVEVGAPDDVPHVPDKSKLAAKLFQSYIRSSKFDVFHAENSIGTFKQLTVRYAESTDQMMIIFGIQTAEIRGEIDELVKDIVDYFTNREGKELNVTSMYTEEMNKRLVGDLHNKVTHIYGSHKIIDMILGLKFRISPLSFFQVNSASAEVLYNMAIQMGKPDPETSVIDVCCGIGTIGLCFAKHCKDIFGVEIVEAAVDDAVVNATDNEITNAKFYWGNCDDFTGSLVRWAANYNLLTIFDPPRAGLQSKSKEAIRNTYGLNRFLYIACSPKAALKNWVDFGKNLSKTLRGEPFILKEAAGVDMFPHTEHSEMILLFERVPKPILPDQPSTSSS